MTGVDSPEFKHRWFCPTPAWLVLGLLAATGFLFVSEKYRWFTFNQHRGWTVLIAVDCVGVVFLALLLWFIIALIFRLRFQFSIRSLLALVVVVALPFSWLAVEMKKAREQKAAVTEINKIGGVAYDYDDHFTTRLNRGVWPVNHGGVWPVNGGFWPDFGGGVWLVERPPGPAWLQKLLPDDFFAEVATVGFDASQITDAGLEHLDGLSQLQLLSLADTQVTDAGLEHLKGLSQLQELWLDRTQVTDAGLEHLKGLSQLQELWLNGTKVTEAGVAKLRKSLPKCKIDWP